MDTQQTTIVVAVITTVGGIVAALINRPRNVTEIPPDRKGVLQVANRKGSWRRVIIILALTLALAGTVVILVPRSDQESHAKAMRYLDAKDYAKALPLFKKAAGAGNTESMYKLGDFYRFGWGVAFDFPEALKWYKSAAEKGNSWGMCDAGDMYRDGWPGVAPDYKKASDFYQQAAEKGNSWAMCNLAALCENGWPGVVPDYKKANDLYQRATADTGPGSPKEVAKEGLKRLRSQGRP